MQQRQQSPKCCSTCGRDDEAPKTDRRPERRQHLNVRHLHEPVRRKGKREGGDDGGVVPFRERERQKVRSHRAEDERGDERDVVAEQRQMRQHGQRRADRRQAQKVLRERERARSRKKGRRVPPVGGQRNGLRGPPQNPRIEKRIAGIVRNTVRRGAAPVAMCTQG